MEVQQTLRHDELFAIWVSSFIRKLPDLKEYNIKDTRFEVYHEYTSIHISCFNVVVEVRNTGLYR